jgi:hypothetical protein
VLSIYGLEDVKMNKILIGLFIGLLLVGTVSAVAPDSDNNGCISLEEISSYVSLWLNGSGVTLGQVSTGVSWWVHGCTSTGGGGSSNVSAIQFLGDDRAIDWDPGIPGGIPNYPVSVNVMDYGAVGDGVADDTNAIKNAMNAAPAGTAIYLPAGTYKTTSKIKITKSIVIRGAGVDQTKIICGNPNDYCFAIEYGYDTRTYNPLVSGYNKGSTQVTISNAANFQVGKYVEFRQDDDPAVYKNNDGTSSTEDNTGQFNKIIGKNGNTLILEKPLYYNYSLAFNAGARPVNSMIEKAGLEDFYLEIPEGFTGAYGNIGFIGAANCWIKNIWSHNTYKGHVFMKEAYANEIRDSVFQDTWMRGGGGHGYGIHHEARPTDNLYINNVFWKLRHAMIVSWGATGNVFAYNYDADPAAGDYANQSQINTGWLYPDMSVHGHYSYMNLYEGNVAQDYIVDNTWSSNGPTTLFRSRVLRETQFVTSSSLQKFPHILIDSKHRFQNVIANEIGKAGQSSIGYVGRWTNSNSGTGSTILWVSLVVNDTAYIHGNYEYLHNTYVGGWNPSLTQNIPNSLFLTSKPSFFENLPWPAFGPEYLNSGNKIPAQVRFETLRVQGKI